LNIEVKFHLAAEVVLVAKAFSAVQICGFA